MTRTSESFSRLFLERERSVLEGNGSSGLIRMTIFLSFLLLSLAASLSAYHELKARMTDPFTNSIELPLSRIDRDMQERLLDSLLFSDRKKEFLIDTVEFFQVTFDHILDHRAGFALDYRSRSLPAKGKLTERILSDPAILLRKVTQTDVNEAESCGVVVTEKLIQDNGLDPRSVEWIPYQFGERADFTVLLPVRAVVSRLPDKCDLAFTDLLARLRNDPLNSGWMDYESKTRNLQLLISASDRQRLEKELESYCRAHAYRLKDLKAFRLDQDLTWFGVDIYIGEDLDMARRKVIRNDLSGSLSSVTDIRITLPWNCADDLDENRFPLRRHSLNLMFQNMDKVRSLEVWLAREFEVFLDLTRVESARNFALVASLTLLLSLGLFLLSMFSLTLYMHYLIGNHIRSNRSGLGTLAAFGLSGREVRGLFLKVIALYLGRAALGSVVFCFFISYLLKFFPQVLPLHILDPVLFFALAAVFLVVLLTARRTLDHYLSATPGDLIYQRTP